MTTNLLFDAGPGNTAAAVDPRAAMAAKMYPPPAPAPQPTSPNAQVTAVRAADPSRAMYSPEKQLGSSLNDLVFAVAPEGDAGKLADLRVEFGHIAADVGFDRSDLDRLAGLVRARTIKPLTAEQTAAERRESIAQLRQTYRDPGEFDRALSAAKGLVQRDDRLFSFVNHAGIEANPWLVMRLAEIALSGHNKR